MAAASLWCALALLVSEQYREAVRGRRPPSPRETQAVTASGPGVGGQSLPLSGLPGVCQAPHPAPPPSSSWPSRLVLKEQDALSADGHVSGASRQGADQPRYYQERLAADAGVASSRGRR